MKLKLKDLDEHLNPILEVDGEWREKIIDVSQPPPVGYIEDSYLCVKCQKKELSEEELKTGYCIECWKKEFNGESKEEVDNKLMTDLEILKEEKLLQEKENIKENKINWIDDKSNFWDWDKLKGHMKKIYGSGDSYDEKKPKWFMHAHSKDTCYGKPQLIDSLMKNVSLIKKMYKSKWNKSIKDYETFQEFKFFDERVNEKYDGLENCYFSQEFFMYKIVTPDNKEIFLWSEKMLPNCSCTFKGMMINLPDFAEMTKNLKVKSISKVFFVKEFTPDIKLLIPSELPIFTKKLNLTENEWLNHLAFHRFGSYNRFPEEVELLRSSFILSGKKEDYPMHLVIMGTAGTKKTMGHIECLAYKFSNTPNICAGDNTRIKFLSPSFKEKPANIGFLAKSERIGFIDEIGKMIEFESTKYNQSINNCLGELNDLLEHKLRTVGSGNDNSCIIKANSKYLFVTNPVSNHPTIYSHIGLLDPTFMSRLLWWVQDKEEQEFCFSGKSIETKSRGHIVPEKPTYPPTVNIDIEIENSLSKVSDSVRSSGSDFLSVGVRGSPHLSMNDFITIFDTCYSFICQIDSQKVKELVDRVSDLAQEPMKSSVWKPRAEHHVSLLVDGLIKHRCLFKDYDTTFTAKQEDYDSAEKILLRMVNGWNTILTPGAKT